MRDIFVVNSRRIIKSFRIISRCVAAVQAYFLRDITRVLSDNKDPNTNCCAARIRRLRNCCKTNRILSDNSDTWVYQFYFHWCCPTPVTKVNYRISENMFACSRRLVFWLTELKIFCMMANRPREKSS